IEAYEANVAPPIILKATLYFHLETKTITLFLMLTARTGIVINLLLGFFNLLPIPPLDGGKLLYELLPYKQSQWMQQIEPYGFIILILLAYSGLLGALISPLIQFSLHCLRILFQL
ncbi:MAG: site-2 protease family protein, partial [Legionella sp.]